MSFVNRSRKGRTPSHEVSDPLILEMGSTTEQIIRTMLADSNASFERTRRWAEEQEDNRIKDRAFQRESRKRWDEHHRVWEDNFLAEQAAISARRRRQAEERQ